METSDQVYKAYLAELEALEKFRITYSGLHPDVPLARDDQDVQRLIEALAMFSARTRAAGQRSVISGAVRMFRQHFPYILNPQPSMSMMTAEVGRQFADAAVLPKGSYISLSKEARADDGRREEQFATFTTLMPLRLLPITIDACTMYRRGSEGFRIVIEFSSHFHRGDEIGDLSLHVDHLNDFASSLAVLRSLEEHTTSVGVVFDETVSERTKGTRCAVRYGPPEPDAASTQPYEHPVERVRSFFGFPQQELFVTVSVPPPPTEWRTFSVFFDVDAKWPPRLRLVKDAFKLHTTPILNIAKAMSDPIEHNGTRERHAIEHTDRSGQFVLHSTLGAYRMETAGLVPLRPSVIETTGNTYDVDYEGEGPSRRAFLAPSLPDAFDTTVRLLVDGFWHQPRFSEEPALHYDVRPLDRHLEGVAWRCLAAPTRSQDNPLHNEHDALLSLLSLKNQRFLGMDDLHFLLQALGAVGGDYFDKIIRAIAEVSVKSSPYVKKSTGFKYTYKIKYRELEPEMRPSFHLFNRKLLEILTIWSTEHVIEIDASVPNLGLQISYSSTGGTR